MARETSESKTIPTKRVYLNDPNELPSCYSSTPGGTLYSTTPGGTKIVYEKSFLLNLRNSPISKTPPTYGIPDNLIKGNNNPPPNNNVKRINRVDNKKQAPMSKNKASDDDHQFQMDI